jgi:hypothetical protein
MSAPSMTPDFHSRDFPLHCHFLPKISRDASEMKVTARLASTPTFFDPFHNSQFDSSFFVQFKISVSGKRHAHLKSFISKTSYLLEFKISEKLKQCVK